MSPSATSLSGEVRVFAPAKINWALTVDTKREDGYHNIHTIFQTVAFGDLLTVRRLNEHHCKVSCNAADVPISEDNLIFKAWRMLSEAWPDQVGGIEVYLEKRIPMGGGLGGGSSDAVAALLAIRKLYDLPLTLDDLAEPARRLGSDCAFFLRGGTAIGSGRGEQLQSIENRLPPLPLVVVNPGFHSSTPQAYGLVKPCHYEDGRAVGRVAGAIETGDLESTNKFIKNIFHPLVTKTNVRYAGLIDRMKQVGLPRPMLTGSGATMFAIAESVSQARAAQKFLQQHYPFVAVCKLRRTGARVLPLRSTRP